MIRIVQGQQSLFILIRAPTHQGQNTALLLELMERIEHASDYLQQTNIHRQLETIHP